MPVAAHSDAGSAWIDPGPDTPIFVSGFRELGPESSSRWSDDVWDLGPAQLRGSSDSLKVHFQSSSRGKVQINGLPAGYVLPAKRMTFLMLNEEVPVRARQGGSNSAAVMAAATAQVTARHIGLFTWFLEERKVHRLCDATEDDLMDYLRHVAGGTQKSAFKKKLIAAITRLHNYEDLLPPEDRLIAMPWSQATLRRFLGNDPQTGENKLIPISTATMSSLLYWCIQIVEAYQHPPDSLGKSDRPRHTLRMFGSSGAEIEVEDKLGSIQEHVLAAAFVIVAYLSGMRPEEVLDLRRGCLTQFEEDEGGVVRWQVNGKKFKSARGRGGESLSQGVERKEPWVVVETAANAIDTMESLHPKKPLFLWDSFEKDLPRRGRTGDTRTVRRICKNIEQLVKWINEALHSNGLAVEQVPEDDAGNLHASRFRRTVAWHIVRQPSGYISLGLQYGHVRDATTQGYGNRIDSGFPDDIAFEQLMAHVDRLDEIAKEIDAGGKLSGPARHRLEAGSRKLSESGFSGEFASQAELNRLKKDPDLKLFVVEQQFAGCMYDRSKSMCREIPIGDGLEPDLSDCNPSCQNIVRTDSDIVRLETEISRLQREIDSELLPEPIKVRLSSRVESHEKTVRRHRKAAK